MEALYLPVPRTSNTQIPKFKPSIQHIFLTGRNSSLQCHFAKNDEPLPRRNDLLKNSKKGSKLQVKTTRRLISISTADSGYKGQWTCDFILTLRELQLADLAEEGHGDAEVYIGLDIQKHAGFGYSIDGKIVSSLLQNAATVSPNTSKRVVDLRTNANS